MQTQLMFFDVSAQGPMSNLQKMAVKVPMDGQKGNGADNGSEFSDMISALMDLAPEKLKDSLEEMEWIEIDETSGELTPLIDLTEANPQAFHMMQMLLGEVTPGQEDSGTPAAEQLPSEELSLAKEKIARMPTGDLQPEMQITDSEEAITALVKGDGDTTAFVKSAPQPEDPSFETPHGKTELKPLFSPHPPDMQKQGNAKEPVAETSDPNETDKPSGNRAELANDASTRAKAYLSKLNDMTDHNLQPTTQSTEQGANAKWSSAPHGSDEQLPSEEGRQASKESAKQDTNGRIKLNVETQFQKQDHFEAPTKEPDNTLPEHRHAPRETQSTVLTRASSETSTKGVDHVHTYSESTPTHGDTKSDIIRQIVQRMTLKTQGTQSSMTIRLKPEFLGQLHMQVSTDHHQVVVRMAAESLAVKEMIEQGLQHLRTELQQHGLEIDRFDVFVANDNEERHQGQDAAGFRQALKQRQKHRIRRGHASSEEGDAPVSANRFGVARASSELNEIDYFA